MSLNWNLSKIQDHDTLCWHRRTQAQLDAEGNGETLESLTERMTWRGSDWSFPNPDEGPVEKLASADKEPYVQRMNPVTHVIILATTNIGMGEITTDNTVEVYTRIACIEEAYGAFLNQDEKPRYLTFEEVTAHVGLKVNVADMSWREFSVQTMDGLRREILRRIVVPEAQQANTLGFGIPAHVLARDAQGVLLELDKSVQDLLGELSEDSHGYAEIDRASDKIRRWSGLLEDVANTLEEAEGDLIAKYELEEHEEEMA